MRSRYIFGVGGGWRSGEVAGRIVDEAGKRYRRAEKVLASLHRAVPGNSSVHRKIYHCNNMIQSTGLNVLW